MKLVRKNNSPTFIDEFGIEHPDLTLSIIKIFEDKLNKSLIFVCKYFHEKTCSYESLKFTEVVFNFSNNYENPNIGSLGWPTYTQVKEDITIDDNGNLIPLNEDMSNWIVNQEFILDIEGKKFGDNWEIIN